MPYRDIPGGRTPLIGGVPGELEAKAWYVWDRHLEDGTDRPGEHGVEIDAFSRTSNDFISDYFVDVSPDGSSDPSHPDLGPLSFTANEDGYVSTEKLKDPITITAREVIGDGFYRYHFVGWHVISRFTDGSPMPVDNGNSITIYPQNTMKAYAMYDGDPVSFPQVEIVPQSYAVYDRAGIPFSSLGRSVIHSLSRLRM